jgi:DNA-binding CsgD family transcriptional regulator
MVMPRLSSRPDPAVRRCSPLHTCTLPNAVLELGHVEPVVSAANTRATRPPGAGSMSGTAQALAAGRLSVEEYFDQLDPERRYTGDMQLLLAVFEARPHGLSRRQLQVLALAARGYTAHETADRLGIGLEAVKTYRVRAYTQLGARNITNAIAILLRSRR